MVIVKFPETKYPELCALCDDDKECKYKGEDYNGPTEALNCLVNGKNEGKEKGGVAYSSLRFVREYFAVSFSDVILRFESFQANPID